MFASCSFRPSDNDKIQAFATACSVLALLTPWHVSLIRCNISIFFSALCVYVYRDVWPLATFNNVPLDLGEGQLLWVKIGMMALISLIIPLSVPRKYIPYDSEVRCAFTNICTNQRMPRNPWNTPVRSKPARYFRSYSISFWTLSLLLRAPDSTLAHRTFHHYRMSTSAKITIRRPLRSAHTSDRFAHSHVESSSWTRFMARAGSFCFSKFCGFSVCGTSARFQIFLDSFRARRISTAWRYGHPSGTACCPIRIPVCYQRGPEVSTYDLFLARYLGPPGISRQAERKRQ